MADNEIISEFQKSKYQSDQINELATALAKAQAEIGHASKAADNPFFKSRYADLPAIYNAARPALSKHGLAVTQLTEFADGDKVSIVTTLMHSSGQWMRGWYPVRPVKADPQGLGSAITYARRYAYSAMVGVASDDEDDDGNAASGKSMPANQSAAKSPFSNASLRKTFQDNVIRSYNEVSTIAELDTIAQLNSEKFKEMTASGNEHDLLLLDELRKQYSLKKSQLKQDLSIADSYGQGFAESMKH